MSAAAVEFMRPEPCAERPLIEVEDLRVRFGRNGPWVVQGISLSLNRGECLALVGESGSGKSVTARTLVGLTGYGSHVEASRLQLDGQDLLTLSERDWRRIRGARVGFVLQDALGSLDPLRLVGDEIAEPLRLHTRLGRRERHEKVIELLKAVRMPEPELRAGQYPHQLSGGLRQRALIASAMACQPELLIADEPTTALDAAVQEQILSLLQSLRSQHTAMLIISHDLAVVSRMADRVAVMHRGVIVEQGATGEVLKRPQHPYTRALLAAVASVHGKKPRASSDPVPRANVSAPEIAVQAHGLTKSFSGPDSKRRTAVSAVSFSLRAGETLGIVGESGSGKTTLARLVLGLETPDVGTVDLFGKSWNLWSAPEQRDARKRMQVVFQDPLASFDPRYSVERVIDEALAVAGYARDPARRARAIELLHWVRLDESFLHRRPIELSGGQRQRIAIARALAPQPSVLVCGEPVSALDVSVQAQILDLLDDLKGRLGLSCLFISHDLGVIRRVSDRILVMKDGVIVESGKAADIFARPSHAYTRTLLGAIQYGANRKADDARTQHHWNDAELETEERESGRDAD